MRQRLALSLYICTPSHPPCLKWCFCIIRGFTDEWALVGRGEFRWPWGHTDTMVAKLLLGEQKQRPPGSWPLLWEGLRHGRPFQRWRRGKIKERSGASQGMLWISSSFNFTKLVCVFLYLTCPFLQEESWNSFTELSFAFPLKLIIWNIIWELPWNYFAPALMQNTNL